MTASILIVDDIPANIRLLAEMLKAEGYHVRPTSSPTRALIAAQTQPPDIILLDVNMPEMNGYELCQAIKAEQELKDIPVIFISALGEQESILKGFEVGGVDYISKPFNTAEVLARIHTHLELQTKRREVEQLRQREVAHLTQMNQLKDDVLRMVSHDLRNPIGAIYGITEHLISYEEEEWPSLEEIKPFLEHCMHASKQMMQLVDDLLDIARAEGRIELEKEVVPISMCVSTAFDSLFFTAEKKKIALTYQKLGDTAAKVEVDMHRFVQVLQNLISNAIKYTPPGGSVIITTDATPTDVVIQVSDTGLGIPAQDLPFIFDKFYRINSRLHRQEDGTGLGLAIVKALTEQHGGQITVESEAGVGSTFTLTLPRVIQS